MSNSQDLEHGEVVLARGVAPRFVRSHAALPVGLAVVGAGHWGQNLVRAFTSLERARVVAVCDSNQARLSEVSAPVRRETDFRALLAGDDIVALVVATPPRTHASLVIEALRAGKHVFVEKPMALSLEDALRIRAASLASGRRVMVGFVLQYHPAVRLLRAQVDQGALGTVTELFAQRGGARQNGSEHSAWWSLAPHDVSLAYELLGGPAVEVGVARVSGEPDAVRGKVAFGGGRSAWLSVDGRRSSRVRRVVVAGSRATAVFDDLEPRHKVKIYRVPSQAGSELERIERELERHRPHTPALDQTEPLRLEAQHFVDRLLDGGAFRSDLDHGVDVIAVLASGQKSMGREGTPVAVPDWRRLPLPGA
jgi:predicted dehydrogenase